ncbi:MAG: DUF2203 domain-containing protein [Firmicutes bacterium]|nr:DUF2203 domain-containing protein [Bacillota bacterium]
MTEANALVPQLRALVQRLRTLHEDVQREFVHMERMRLKGYAREGNVIRLFDQAEATARLERMVAAGNALIEQIQRLGCILRDIEAGVVDFPAEIDGRPVYLCWQCDEPWVMYYHDPEAGHQGRRPLPAHAT